MYNKSQEVEVVVSCKAVFCARYDTPSNFTPPGCIFKRPCSEANNRYSGYWHQNGYYSVSEVGNQLKYSVSGFVLDVLANLHNDVMSRKKVAKSIKIVAVILLDLTALSVVFLVLAEAVPRLVYGIAVSLIRFSSVRRICTGADTHILDPLCEGVSAWVQILAPFHTAYQFTTSNENVWPLNFAYEPSDNDTCE